MYCKNCGKQIADGSRFCVNCGASLTDSHQETSKEEKLESEVENTQTVMPAGELPDCSGLRLNDSDIKTLIRKHRSDAEADTPYVYAAIVPSMLKSAMFGALASAGDQYSYYIFNFTRHGLHLYKLGKLGLSKNLDVRDYQFIPASDIVSVRIKDGIISSTIKIEHKEDGKIKEMKIEARNKVNDVYEQGSNLNRIRQMFNK
jgi:hypothetical protein